MPQVLAQDFTAEERRNYIGGSDASLIYLGKTPWGKTVLRLWCEKVGLIEPDDLSNNLAVLLGNMLEDVVAKLFTWKTGKKVRNSKKQYIHSTYNFLVAHIDRIVEGTDFLLECKTSSPFNINQWKNDNIPELYKLQVIWYLGITGRKKAYIACLFGNSAFEIREIEFDKELFNKMLEKSIEFWECVKNNIPPKIQAEDNSLLLELYPEQENSEYIENEELDTRIKYYFELIHEIKEIEKVRDTVKAEIKDAIKSNIGITTKNYIVTWNRKGEKANFSVKRKEVA